MSKEFEENLKRAAAAYKIFKQLIDYAYQVSGKDNLFTASCESFLNEMGYLTIAQVEALKKSKPMKSLLIAEKFLIENSKRKPDAN